MGDMEQTERQKAFQELHDKVYALRDAICIPILDKMTAGLNWLNGKLKKYE